MPQTFLLPDDKTLRAHFKKHDPEMARVIQKVGPFKLKRNRNYFIVLSRSIVSQQISTKAAESIYARFHALFGGRQPTPTRLAEIKDPALRAAGLSRQKVIYLKDLARCFLDKTVRPRTFLYLENEEIIDQLTQVHGVGRWTAEMFLIFSLNRMNVLPVGDLGLQIAVQKIYGLREKPSVTKLKALARKWNPYESAATWYCWRSLNNTNVSY